MSANAKDRILIVDDEKPTRDVMARILSRKYECQTAPDAEQAMKAVAADPSLALLITDYKMPGDNGVELIRKAKAANPALACMIITAFGEIDLAVEAMREGADDFLTKPITDIDRLEMRVAKAIALRDARIPEGEASDAGRAAEAPGGDKARAALAAFTGTSPAMQSVYRLIRKVAPTNSNILVEGPSGAGKELVAKAIHALSARASGPFVAVECSALPSTLLETELFGSIKGAFTDARDRVGCFEAADGGTIFLDEIGEIDANVQVKLLRVLETRTFQRVGETIDRHSDFRLVTATNKDLLRLVAAGLFREDLYYRLNVIDVRLPPLKDRPGDVAELARRFVKEFAAANGGSVTGISGEALRVLAAYSWPGNVRQLRNAIEKMVVLSSGGELGVSDIPAEIASPAPAQTPPAAPPVAASAAASGGFSLAEIRAAAEDGAAIEPLKDSERNLVITALRETGGNVTKAAERLGISRRTLHRRINEWNLK